MTQELDTRIVAEVERIAARYPQRQAALLPALRILEREVGAVTDEGMVAISRLLGVAPAHTFGVLTFYTHYRRPTDGRYILQVCSTLPCALRGSDELCELVCRKVGVRVGQTTPDGLFTVKKVECLAACDQAPVLQVNDEYEFRVDEQKLDEILQRLRGQAR